MTSGQIVRFREVGGGAGGSTGVAVHLPVTSRLEIVSFLFCTLCDERYYHAWPVWYPGRVGN